MKSVENESSEAYISPKQSEKEAEAVKLEIKKQEEKEAEEIKYQQEKTIEFNQYLKDNPKAIDPNISHSKSCQNKHFRNTPEYKRTLENGEHKSYFDETKITPNELNKFVLDNLSNIEWVQDFKNGTFKGYLEFNKDIAYNVNNKTNEITSTNRIKVHFSKNGFHSVPTKKVEK